MKLCVRFLTTGLVVALSLVLAFSGATIAQSNDNLTAQTGSNGCIYVEPDTLFFYVDLCHGNTDLDLDTNFFYIHDCGDTGLFWNVTADQPWLDLYPDSSFDSSPVSAALNYQYLPDIYAVPTDGDTLRFSATITVSFPGTLIPPKYVVASLAYFCSEQPNALLVVEPKFSEHHLPPDNMAVGYIAVDDNISSQNFSVSYQTMASWISLPETFAPVYTPTTLEYTVNSYNLTPGMYVDSIVIFMYDSLSNELVDSDRVQVTLYVDASSPEYDLVVFPHMIEVSTPHPDGANYMFGHILFYEANNHPLYVDFYNYKDWLTLSYYNPPLTAPDSVRYDINPTGLAPGVYYDTITFVARVDENGEPVDIETTIIVLTVEDIFGLSVTPESFNFTATPGEHFSDSMQITSQTGETLFLNFTSNYSWLIFPDFFTPPTTPANIVFDVNTTDLAPGRYYDQITITAYNSKNELVDEKIVPILLLVEDNANYQIMADKDSLHFTINTNTQTHDSLYIYEAGGASIQYGYFESASWMLVAPAEPNTLLMTPSYLYVVINPGDLPPGHYTHTLTIYSFNNTTFDSTIKRIPVDLILNDDDPTRANVEVEPNFINFTAKAGTVNSNIPVYIHELNGLNLNYNVDIRKGNWLRWNYLLTVLPTMPDTAFFEINTENMAPGVYYDSAIFYKPTDDLPTYEDIAVHFTLNVVEDTTVYDVDIHTAPEEITFDLNWGEYRCDSLFVYESNGFPVPFLFSNNKPWLHVEPFGIYPYITPTTIKACAFADDSILPGVYFDTITIYPYPSSDTLYAPHYIPVKMVVHDINQPPTGDSLVISSVEIPECDKSCYKLSVYTQLQQKIKGANIPFEIPAGVEICSLSTAGLYTENWDKTVLTIDKQSGYFQTALINTHGYEIPAGLTNVFDVYFKLKDCYDGQIIYWDTTFSSIQNRALAFVDSSYGLLHPGYDKYRNPTTVSSCIPGDFNGDQISDIEDLVLLVDFIFNLKRNGYQVYPVEPRAFDFNNDCSGPDLADLIYLIDYLYLYQYMAFECGCIGDVTYPKTVNNNYRISSRFEDSFTIISLDAPGDIRGVDLKLTGFSGERVESLLGDKLDLIKNDEIEQLTIGLFDMDGNNVITSGQNDLLQIEGEVTIERVLLADDNYTSIYPFVGKGSTLPDGFELSQNYPNPFNPTTEIKFSLPQAGQVVLEIFNINGQLVATLADGRFDAGWHTLEWNSRDNNNETVASGIYLYRLESNGLSQSRKMMLLK